MTSQMLTKTLCLLLACAAFSYAALDDQNRMSKSVYLYQIKEWSNFEPAAIDNAVRELLQTGESFELNGLHFDAAATQINGGNWVADCVEENTGVSHRTGAFSTARGAMDNCVDDLRSTLVVSVAETIQKGKHTISARAQQLWQGARDILQRAQTRTQHDFQDKYKEFTGAATRRAQENLESAKEGMHNIAETIREGLGIPSSDEVKEKVDDASTHAKHELKEAKLKANEKWQQTADSARGAYDTAKETVYRKAGEAKQKLHEAKDRASDSATRAKQQVEDKSKDVYESAKEGLQTKAHEASEAFESAQQKASRVKEKVKDKAASAYEDAKETVRSNVDAAKDTLESAQESTAEKYEDAKETAARRLAETKRNAQQAYDSAKGKTKEAYEQTKEKVEEKTHEAKQATTQNVEATKSKLQGIFHSASDMIGNIAEKAGVWKHRVGDDAKDAAYATKDFAKGAAHDVKETATPKEGL